MAELPRPVTFDLMSKDPDYYIIILTQALGDFASRERSDAEAGNSPELSLKRAAAAEQILAEIESALSRQPAGTAGERNRAAPGALAGITPEESLLAVRALSFLREHGDLAEEEVTAVAVLAYKLGGAMGEHLKEAPSGN